MWLWLLWCVVGGGGCVIVLVNSGVVVVGGGGCVIVLVNGGHDEVIL